MPSVCRNGGFLLEEGIVGTLIFEVCKQASLPRTPVPGGQTLRSQLLHGALPCIPASRALPRPFPGSLSSPCATTKALFLGIKKAAMTGQLRLQSSEEQGSWLSLC